MADVSAQEPTPAQYARWGRHYLQAANERLDVALYDLDAAKANAIKGEDMVTAKIADDRMKQLRELLAEWGVTVHEESDVR